MSVNFSVNNNSAASNILSNLNYVQNNINTSYTQLSSGNSINSAADNPAGYAISQQMTSQVNGLNTAVQNAQQGVSLIQTATGSMNQVEGILQTMNSLAVEAANGTQNTADLNNLQSEMNALVSQVDNTANSTQFNTIHLLNGSSSAVVTLQVGFDSSSLSQLAFSLYNITSASLGVSAASVNITSQSAALSAISAIQSAISLLSSNQASLGSVQDQLNYRITGLQNESQNLSNAQSVITNTNMAAAYTQFSQNQVLQQVGLSMLGQAQQQPAAILKLLS
ncbi:flagellin N-terminal helical domain-containing protein [Ferroacidibacillus organovorans]|uniref:Flagellin n=1 Tax=Ferroacidibacillus organovorans TaxID=1765683 RepID=A0A162UFP6_9BACL|nr:flagellin [Ferroacidibacillus organovorans]KYP81717.1 flagellin [Ferroacidibacillus organovorans]OAG94257.1 flagellin [Ferroacidibacillus organovorans]OPG16908.1 flagellin [Ferroacidibacillus organovorans]